MKPTRIQEIEKIIKYADKNNLFFFRRNGYRVEFFEGIRKGIGCGGSFAFMIKGNEFGIFTENIYPTYDSLKKILNQESFLIFAEGFEMKYETTKDEIEKGFFSDSIIGKIHIFNIKYSSEEIISYLDEEDKKCKEYAQKKREDTLCKFKNYMNDETN